MQQVEATARRLQSPQPGRRRGFLVFVELRVQVLGAVARAIADEHETAIGQIGRTHVVEMVRLVRNLGDLHGLALAEAARFVQLPVPGTPLVLRRRRADDHAEHRARAIPRHRRIAYRDCIRTLHAGVAVTGLGRQVAQRPVRIADHQVAAATGRLHVGAVVAEHAADRGEVTADRELRDEQDRVLQRLCAGSCAEKADCGRQQETKNRHDPLPR